MLLALVGAACADHVTDVGTDLVTLGRLEREKTREIEVTPPPSSAGLEDNCPAQDGSNYAACITDSAGQAFELNGSRPLQELQGPPPYGLSFRLVGGIELTEQDLTTEGPHAAIKVYASSHRVLGGCLPEYDEDNRIAARAVLTERGGMHVFVDDELPSGTQLAFILESELIEHHLAPLSSAPCDSVEDCMDWGYAARSYIGAEPPPTTYCDNKR
jgi:hypothetical protein